MSKAKIFSKVLAVFTLISPLLSFSLTYVVGEGWIFGISGMLRYSWVMWLFIPLGILSIVIACVTRADNPSHKEHCIIACVSVLLLVLFGSFRFMFPDSYDAGKLAEIESKIGLDLPSDVKVATREWDSRCESYVKVHSGEEKERFERELIENPVWCEDVGTKIKALLPFGIEPKLEEFDRFVFYNMTENEFNEYPPYGESECIFIAYDYKMGKMLILDGMTLVLT